MRNNNRKNDEMREVKVTKNYIIHPEGSVLIEFGNTKVICNATIEEKIPRWLKGTNSGWITAEYSMLPRATHTRVQRESAKGKLSGRTMEIQRLIGRALRAAIDLEKLGERTIMIDCDVIQADGGTRTASITGAYLALELAVERLIDEGKLKEISWNRANGFLRYTLSELKEDPALLNSFDIDTIYSDKKYISYIKEKKNDTIFYLSGDKVVIYYQMK